MWVSSWTTLRPQSRSSSISDSSAGERGLSRASGWTRLSGSTASERRWSLAANRLGIRHVSFVVDDLDTVIDGLRSKGLNTVGEVQDYEEIFRLCYVRGPEGIIVELAQRIGSNAAA